MSTRQRKGTHAKKPAKQSGHGRKAPRETSQTSKVQSNPAAIGMVLPRASMTRNGRVQAIADQDYGSSERITGCDLLTPTVNAAITTGVISFSVIDATVGNKWTPLTPSKISTRLQAIEEMYQWYAFRNIKIRYVPNVGSQTPGSVALGVCTDVNIAVNDIPTPTQQQVLELTPAELVPVWGTSVMEAQFRGTKLFECLATTASQSFLAVAGTSLPAAAALTLGQIWVEYVIDFYQQAPLLSSSDLFKRGLPCPRCQQAVSDPSLRKVQRVERKVALETDDYVVLRTQEPPLVELRPLPASATRGTSDLFRDERKSPTFSKRAQSFKG